MDKRAEGESMGWIVNLIIIIVVIIIAGGGMILFLKYEAWKIFPGFEDEDDNSIEDIIVEEGVVISFDEAWRARYLIKGEDAEEIYYNCNEAEGWKWYVEEIKSWRKVTSTESITFKELEIKNQKFIKSLQGLSCEEGLSVLVERVQENDEGRSWGFKSQVGLKVFVNNKDVFYASGHEIFDDIRFLIKKINMVGENE